MRGLYAIVDAAMLAGRGLPIVEFARAVVDAAPAAVQLRAKDASPRETLALLRAIHPACRAANVPLFANDRVDLAVLAGCEGVHVGQTDLPVSIVRRIAPGVRVGISTHDLAQVHRAIAEQPDYIAFGPVFATRSKANPDPVVGIDALADVVRRSPLPVVAIGGIDLDRAHEVGRIAPVAATIAALVPDGASASDLGWVTRRVRELHSAITGSTLGRAVC